MRVSVLSLWSPSSHLTAPALHSVTWFAGTTTNAWGSTTPGLGGGFGGAQATSTFAGGFGSSKSRPSCLIICPSTLVASQYSPTLRAFPVSSSRSTNVCVHSCLCLERPEPATTTPTLGGAGGFGGGFGGSSFAQPSTGGFGGLGGTTAGFGAAPTSLTPQQSSASFLGMPTTNMQSTLFQQQQQVSPSASRPFSQPSMPCLFCLSPS